MASFGHRHSLLGHPVPAQDLGLPHGRLTGHHLAPGPGRGFHVSHLRDTTGVGAPSTPGTAVLSRAGCRARPAPAASQRPVPAPRTHIPPAGLRNYGASTEVHAIHPSGLPLTCGPPDGTGGPRAYPCAPHPAVTGGARQGGAGPRARARNYTTDIAGPPIREFTRIVQPRVATADEDDDPFTIVVRPIPVPLPGGAQQKVPIARSVFPPEALVSDHRALLLDPLDCLFPARRGVVTGDLFPFDDFAPRTAGSPRTERLAKAWYPESDIMPYRCSLS